MKRKLFEVVRNKVGSECHRQQTAVWEDAHLISSLTHPDDMDPESDFHAPALDIDIPCRYIPSATPGHGHLFFDIEMRWRQYRRLLRVLADVGIIEEGYCKASIARSATYVRTPHFPKGGPDTPDLAGLDKDYD